MFLKRRPGLSVDEFRAYYEERHVPLCLKYMAGPQRYFRRFVEHPPGLPELEFDVITEIWFPSRGMLDSVAAALARDGMPPDVIADEENFIDRAKSRFCSVSEAETPGEALVPS